MRHGGINPCKSSSRILIQTNLSKNNIEVSEAIRVLASS